VITFAPVREPNVDPAKLRRLALRLTLREFEWLRDTVWFAFSTPHDVDAFIASALQKSKDPDIRTRAVARAVAAMTADEVVWFCDHFKRPTQTSRRRGMRRSRRRHGDRLRPSDHEDAA
jgi:hypothetical protein